MLDTALTPHQLKVRQANSKLIAWVTFKDESIYRGCATKVFTDFEAEAWAAVQNYYGAETIKTITFLHAKPTGILTAEQSLFKIHLHTLTVMIGDNHRYAVYGMQTALKALSFKQPWADLIMAGFKTIETRKWKTDWRGRLLICSSLEYDNYFPNPGQRYMVHGHGGGEIKGKRIGTWFAWEGHRAYHNYRGAKDATIPRKCCVHQGI